MSETPILNRKAGEVGKAAEILPGLAALPVGTRPRRRRISGWELIAHHGRQFGTFAGLLGLCAVLWILTPHFLTVSNLLNVAQQTAINAVIAVGLTFVIISGGTDLPGGPVVPFSGVRLATLLQRGVPAPPATPGGRATGARGGSG